MHFVKNIYSIHLCIYIYSFISPYSTAVLSASISHATLLRIETCVRKLSRKPILPGLFLLLSSLYGGFMLDYTTAIGPSNQNQTYFHLCKHEESIALCCNCYGSLQLEVTGRIGPWWVYKQQMTLLVTILSVFTALT